MPPPRCAPFFVSLIVQKYGGTSVGNPERILNVARRVIATQDAGNRVVVVVSAMSGVTDNLIGLARQISPSPSEREMDVLLATGEQTTIALTAIAINALGRKAVSLTGGCIRGRRSRTSSRGRCTATSMMGRS